MIVRVGLRVLGSGMGELMGSVVRRFRRRSALGLRRLGGRLQTWLNSIRIRARARSTTPALPRELGRQLDVVMSYRVDSPDRLALLRESVRVLREQLGDSGLTVRVRDASPPALSSELDRVWADRRLVVDRVADGSGLAAALATALRDCEKPFFYLHFDDMVTVGLDPSLLRSACTLLRKYEGLVNVVAPIWPKALELDPEARQLRITSYELSKSPRGAPRHGFKMGGAVAPVITEVVGGHRFGIFENFNYGFFLNHLIAPTNDYLRRLEWYRTHVSPTSAHEIEMAAAAKAKGPFWTHLAVCLDGVSLLDLDYAHTAEAVRPEDALAARVYAAVRDGWSVSVSPRRLGQD